MVDFPTPEGPTKATFCPALIVKLIPFKTGISGRVG